MLNGVRIIEFEGLGPGPFAGMLLADLGAEVIVIHRAVPADTPGRSDQNPLDRGKRSIVLDLKAAEDLETVQKLLKTADGLIEGMRPGVMERLGLGPDVVMRDNPNLVYGRMTGWGQTGPLAEVAGHDLNYISRAGALWYASNPGETPFTPPTLVGDIGGGALYLVIGMLSALLQVKHGGQGCVVDAAIVDGAAHMMSLLLSLKASGGLNEARGTSILDGPHWSRSYKAACGGFVSVQCLEPKFYQIFLERLGLSQDEAFVQQFNRALWPELTARLSEIFSQKTRAHWDQIFLGSDACVAPVLSPDEAQSDPHMNARDIWYEAQGHLQARPAPRFSNWDATRAGSIPQKDQDRDAILRDLKGRKE